MSSILQKRKKLERKKQTNKVKTTALDNLHPNMLSNLRRTRQSHIPQLQYQEGCYHRNPDFLLADQTRFCQFLKCRFCSCLWCWSKHFSVVHCDFPKCYCLGCWILHSLTGCSHFRSKLQPFPVKMPERGFCSTLWKTTEKPVQHFLGHFIPSIKKRQICNLLYTIASQRILMQLKWTHLKLQQFILDIEVA